MDFLPKDISEYADNHTSEESPLLKKLNRETHLKMLKPRMLSGHLQGRFLSMISKLLRPKRILEIGTYTGYSAICLAEGLQKDGVLYTIDNNPEQAEFVKGFLNEAGLIKKVLPITGNALKIIPELEGNFDLVFIDADKGNYPNYYQLIKDRINPGGLLIGDNVLWSGKVTEPVPKNDKDTQAILEFNELLHLDPSFENILLPIRDGLLMARKIGIQNV